MNLPKPLHVFTQLILRQYCLGTNVGAILPC
jgi:hypothetical protein